MKKTSKNILCMILIVSLLLAEIPLSASAASFKTLLTKTGGRHDISLGAHTNTINLQVYLSQSTRIMFYDSAYREIGAKSYNATGLLETSIQWDKNYHTIGCASNVRYVAFYLDSNKSAIVKQLY